MLIYCLKTCDTCRKALAALAANGRKYDLRDLRADGMDPQDLAAIVAQNGAAAVNKSSTTWRALDEAARAGEPAQLIAAHPTLLKRPAICIDGRWTLGWSAQVQAAVLG